MNIEFNAIPDRETSRYLNLKDNYRNFELNLIEMPSL
jgi:hypothetical protein